MTIVEIHKRFRGVVLYKNAYLVWEIVFNEFVVTLTNGYNFIVKGVKIEWLWGSCSNGNFIIKSFSKNILNFQSLV